MTAPTVSREGARIGGVTQTQFAVVCRSEGDNAAEYLHLRVYFDAGHTSEVLSATYESATLNAANNWQATAYVSGLSADRIYYWQVTMSDNAARGAGNITTPTGELFSGKVRMLPSTSESPWRIGFGSCFYAKEYFDSATKARGISRVFHNILSLNLDWNFVLGDIYYPDVGATTGGYADYGAGAWYNQLDGVDDGTVARFRTNFITTMDGAIQGGEVSSLSKIYASVPTMYMWDDHDRSYNDCDDLDASEGAKGVGEVNKRDNGHQVGHECFMDLNRAYVNQESSRDFATDALGDSITPEEYFYVDIKPCRFIVLDNRCFRDLNATADTPSKTMLGATQLAWVKARIDDNPEPFLVICSGSQLDGDHGWGGEVPGGTDDNWKHFSYERDELLDYIRTNGDAERTLILSGDTHNNSVIDYHDKGGLIKEFSTGASGWVNSGHQYITGTKYGTQRPSVDTPGNLSGRGGRLAFMNYRCNGYVSLEWDGRRLTVNMVELHAAARTNWFSTYQVPKTGRISYTHVYK